jgi:hypothetical protein
MDPLRPEYQGTIGHLATKIKENYDNGADLKRIN